MSRAGIHLFIDTIYDYSRQISGALVIFLSVIDISAVEEKKIDILGIQGFEIGSLIYWTTVCLTFIFGFITISNEEDLRATKGHLKHVTEEFENLNELIIQYKGEVGQLLRSYLKLFLAKCDLDHNARISLYKIDGENFKLVSRVSNNPILERASRKQIPISQGLVSVAWAEGKCDFSINADPKIRNGDTYYKEVNEKKAIERSVVNGLSMKSRSYYIERISGANGVPKAIVVIESLDQFASLNYLDYYVDDIRTTLALFVDLNVEFSDS